MSKRIITIDDHAGTPIDDAQATQTLTHITIERSGEAAIAWDELNLTAESFDLLVKTIQEFCPDAQPQTPETDADAQAQAEYEAQQGQAQRDAQARVEATQTPKPTQTPAPKVTAPSVPLSQAEQRKRSAAVRAWWQGLTPDTLKALNLPTPKSGPGKMPVAVTEAYATAHA